MIKIGGRPVFSFSMYKRRGFLKVPARMMKQFVVKTGILFVVSLIIMYAVTKQASLDNNEQIHIEKIEKNNVNSLFSFGQLEDSLCQRKDTFTLEKSGDSDMENCPMKGIVSIVVGGRTGNQMWNYASVWGVARFTGLAPYIPHCVLDTLGDMFENLSLSSFEPIRNCSFKFTEVVKSPEEWNNFDNIILPIYQFQRGVVLKYTNDIIREFTFKKKFRDKAQETLRELAGTISGKTTFVGVHVRRTDYAEYLNRKYGINPVQPHFFLNAMNYFRKKYTNCLFVYISDDPKWCEEEFGKIYDVVVVLEPNLPVQDLAIMAACNHTILDYGTFGEWGAILAGGETIFNNMTQNREKPEGRNSKWILMN